MAGKKFSCSHGEGVCDVGALKVPGHEKVFTHPEQQQQRTFYEPHKMNFKFKTNVRKK